MTVRPPTVREFLDSGQELRDDAVPGLFLVSVLEAVVTPRRTDGPEEIRRRIAVNFDCVDMVERGDWALIRDRPGTEEGLQRLVTCSLWEAELLDDPELCDRFEAAAPADMVQEQLELLDMPLTALEVWSPGLFQCFVCMETRIGESGVVVIEHGHLNPTIPKDADSVVCVSCLEDAVARARRTTQQ